jgi:hypothetical protein
MDIQTFDRKMGTAFAASGHRVTQYPRHGMEVRKLLIDENVTQNELAWDTDWALIKLDPPRLLKSAIPLTSHGVIIQDRSPVVK